MKNCNCYPFWTLQEGDALPRRFDIASPDSFESILHEYQVAMGVEPSELVSVKYTHT